MSAFSFFGQPREEIEAGMDAQYDEMIEAKAIELYGGPDARHGNPPLTYAELSPRWRLEWRKMAAKVLRG